MLKNILFAHSSGKADNYGEPFLSKTVFTVGQENGIFPERCHFGTGTGQWKG